MESIIVAAITSVPPTLAALAALGFSVAGNRKATAIDRAVNSRPKGEATLVEKVDWVVEGVKGCQQEIGNVNKRLTVLERKVG